LEYILQIAPAILTFLVVALAAERISYALQKYSVPLISGFLIIGIICGPYALELIDLKTSEKLTFINDIALAFIAFAASSELYLKELRSRMQSIKWLALGQLVATFLILSMAIFLIADMIPYMTEFSVMGKISVSLVSSAILCARSPASVIAVINELRAKGPFSSSALGTTVVVDFCIIIIFTICLSATNAVFTKEAFSFLVILKLISELIFSFVFGLLLGQLLKAVLKNNIHFKIKIFYVVLLGYSSYGLYYLTGYLSESYFGINYHLEPLLICLIGSFYVSNYTNQRSEFLKIIHDVSPFIYMVFFTYAGSILAIDVIPSVWLVTLIIFIVNIGALFIGTYGGAIIAGEDQKHSSLYFTSFLTQAGVGLGLATIITNSFSWGAQFSAIIIAVIIINQLVGPFLFRRAITLLGESRTRAETPEFDGIRDAIIFGLESQSVALARQLIEHGWEVKVATRKEVNGSEYPDLDIRKIDGLTLNALESLDARLSEAIVLMLTDDENYAMTELIYQNIGTKEIVVRLNDRENFDKFHKLDCLVVDPRTAIVSLLDHFVRSPQATSLILGMQKGQDTIELEVLNPDLFGVYLRDLRLPSDIIIISIHRKNQMIISHGYTRLRKNDMITLVGSEESLIHMTDLFDED